jgi:hypothetical protein
MTEKSKEDKFKLACPESAKLLENDTTSNVERILESIGVTHDNVRQDAYNHWQRFINFCKKNSGSDWRQDIRPKLRSWIGVDFRYIDDYLECCLSWGIMTLDDGILLFKGARATKIGVFSMRLNYRIRKFGYTLFIMLSETQTLEGITSRVIGKEGKHYPFFDIENCGQIQAEIGLGKIQVSYGLPDIFITSDKKRSFRAYCYAQVKFTDFLRMQLDLLDAGLLDYNFFYWTVFQGKSTLRTSCKNRPPQEVVSVLKSYSVPIPKTIEKVVYDTGIQKRGISILLGENGKIISGDD